MLSHPTIDRLRELGLIGMAHALEDQRREPEAAQLSFEDCLALLVDREVLERDNKGLKARLRFAGLRQSAAPEDVDYRAHRGLDRALFQRLAQGKWTERQRNSLITGPTDPTS
jgi:DNA replication protein DnaC